MLAEGRRRQLQVLAALALDATAIAAAFALAYLLRFTWAIVPAADSPPAGPYLAVLAAAVPLWLALFAAYGLYRTAPFGALDEAARIAGAVSVGTMALLAASFFYRGFSFSRVWVALAWAVSIVALAAGRALLRMLHRRLRARGLDVQGVLVVGAGDAAEAAIRTLAEHPDLGLRAVGVVAHTAAEAVAGVPVVGTPDEALVAVRRAGARRVVVALPTEERDAALRVVALCREASVACAIVPDLYTLAASGAELDVIGRLPVLALHDSPLRGWRGRLKDALDVVGALLGVLLLLPLGLVIAVAVALDSPGPVFFRQRRIGKGGVPFWTWKFRTMAADAEAMLARDGALRAQYERAYKLPSDPRVTRVGRWLRRTGLDELPQLLNVLKGEMSLVGPRPILEEELRRYGPWERRLLCAKPGLTGLWQVLREPASDYDRRVSLDMYYIDHWSFALDLKILVQTVPALINGAGAH